MTAHRGDTELHAGHQVPARDVHRADDDHVVMRRLSVVVGLSGLVFGLGAAVALHGLPAVLVGEGSFFMFAAPSSLPAGTRVNITLEWVPSLLSLGGLGLLLGVVIAMVLTRLGWRLVVLHVPRR